MEMLLEILRKYLLPPDVDDEAALRKWISAVVDFAQVVAKWIPGEIDDMVVSELAELVEDDAKWARFYRILKRIWGDRTVLAAVRAVEVELFTNRAVSNEDADNLGIPIGLLVQIIMFLWKIWRNR